MIHIVRIVSRNQKPKVIKLINLINIYIQMYLIKFVLCTLAQLGCCFTLFDDYIERLILLLFKRNCHNRHAILNTCTFDINLSK